MGSGAHLMERLAVNTTEAEILLRLPQVLARFPVSRSSWYKGIKEGRYPRQVKLGERMSGWRKSDIDRLVGKTVGG